MSSKKAKRWFRRARKMSEGRFDIPINTITSFTHARAPMAAAGMAYYAIFSLFPLLLLLIVGGSYFLDRHQVYENVLRFVHEVIPVSPSWIDDILRQVLATRGRVGLISLLTLLWSASAFFTSVVYNIDLAWPDAKQRNYLEKRLIGILMIIAFSALLVASMVFEWAANLIPVEEWVVTTIGDMDLLRMFSSLVSFLMSFLLFLALYYWVPNTNVSFSASFWGALMVSVLWKVVTEVFNWYLRSGLGDFTVVYGSLAAIITFLLLVYLASWIILFGAHLCAAIDLWEEMRKRKQSKRRPVPPPDIVTT